LRALNHSLVENLSPHSESVPGRKTRAYRRAIILKPNAPKGAAIVLAQFNAELTKRLQCIGQEPFSACFCNWRFRAIPNDHSKTPLAYCNRGGKPGGASADYKNVRVLPHLSLLSHSNLGVSRRLDVVNGKKIAWLILKTRLR
jgi:hypothetical protein